MKKLALILTGLIVAALSSQVAFAVPAGDGSAEVNFSNFVGSLNRPVFDVDGTTPLSGGTWTVELLAGTSANSLTSVATVLMGTSGHFQGGAVDVSGLGVGAGSSAFFEILVWQTSAGSFANSTIRAQSAVFSNGTGNTIDDPPATPKNLTGMPTGLTVANVAPVPEPSVLALGALGGLALLIRRRK